MAERTRVVEILPYDPMWKVDFEQIKSMVSGYIGDLILDIEHVGSTSVEGLAAKPIIDLDVVIESNDKLPEIIKRLAAEGYEYQGNLDVEGREAFHRKFPDGYRYNLYVCPQDGKGYCEHIAFRDYLRVNESARLEYEKLKKNQAKEFRYDIDKYADGKTEFVKYILDKTLYGGK
ncbi:MAG: GrpB family protein [Candidatus Saccharibacteria bacterium]